MTKRYILRKLVSLVAPDGMAFEEYCIRCAANGIDVSLDCRLYAEWLLRGILSYDSRASLSHEAFSKVQHYVLKAIELGYIFDPSDDYDNAFMQSFAADAMLIDKSFAKSLFELMLSKYRSCNASEAIRKMNNAFGLTELQLPKTADS